MHPQVGDRARAEAEAVRTTFEGAISEAFEGALHLYVEEERKELVAYLEVGGWGGWWLVAVGGCGAVGGWLVVRSMGGWRDSWSGGWSG